MVPDQAVNEVDPFIGTAVTDLPPRTGLAATWWWPKPQVGNTHPGASFPLGMVSACAYSGAYPTGYGIYDLGTEGVPQQFFDEQVASGFTHFQQSGTGAIRKYYNYLRITPMLGALDDLGTQWALTDEVATPGYYAATLSSGIRCEVTVGPKSAVHRFTFPQARDARIVVDWSLGGLALERSDTVPLRAHLATMPGGAATGEIVVEGAPLAAHMQCDTPAWRQLLWYDRRLMPGGTRLEFDDIRPTTLRPFGLMWAGPTSEGQSVEIAIGFSLRGPEQAHQNLRKDCPDSDFGQRRSRTKQAWSDNLNLIEVTTDNPQRRTIFATALYHSLIKPCLAPNESPFWIKDGAFAFDISTMWDIYRTQLPLLTLLRPDLAVELGQALITIAEQEGNFPIGYRMARGADRFSRQASALAHTFLADLCQQGHGGIDWDWALVHMLQDLRRTYGEDFLINGYAHPISHTLDLAYGYWCTLQIAKHCDDPALVEEFAPLAAQWVNAFEPETGLLRDSTFYEGGRWNYSFRLVHDMATRIEMSGGRAAFVDMLDSFFGFGADPVTQPGVKPGRAEMKAGYELNRFEGLNNEPDMEAPWAYCYAGRPDRTAEVVHSGLHQMFGNGPGGLPGNDDSGALSSWYVWASLGLFPVAGQNLVLINAPAFEGATIHTSGQELVISTTGFVEPEPGGPVQYVQSVTFNGTELDRCYLTGHELMSGGHLHVVLGSDPTTWRGVRPPPSFPTGPASQPPPEAV